MLFAAYAVLFVWSQNLGETDPLSVVVPLVAVVLGAMLATIVLGALFHDRRRGAIVATPLVVGLLMYGHAAHYLTPLGVPGFVQQVAWIALVIVGVIAAVRLDTRHLATIDVALTRIAALLIGVALVAIVSFHRQRRLKSDGPSRSTVQGMPTRISQVFRHFSSWPTPPASA